MNKKDFRDFAIKGQNINGNTFDQYSTHINSMTPYIIEERPMNITQMDVFSRLMKDRIIFMGTGVDDNVANIITAQLLFLESIDAKKDVLLYINSPGGSVHAGLGIYDTMNYVTPDINTICTGLAASMGAVLLASGAAGKRAALPHSRIMIHQPMAGMQGQASDMEISLRQTLLLKKDLYDILAKHSGKSYEDIERDSDRDYWMKAAEAKKYGLIDEVLERKTED